MSRCITDQLPMPAHYVEHEPWYSIDHMAYVHEITWGRNPGWIMPFYSEYYEPDDDLNLAIFEGLHEFWRYRGAM